MLWIIAIIIAVIMAVIIMFMHGAAKSRPNWYQQELDDEQMWIVSKKKSPSEDERKEKD